jgi:UDP-4-amino-4,6-dideoxy-N-acetyl-beta-L-altrosamine transaminase
MSVISYGRHDVDESDIAAVLEVLRSDWLTQGPTIEKFERAFAEKVGARYAVACNSGTAALHLACLALELGSGMCVIVPTLTFLATANASRFVGADVVFSDVDPETGLLRIDDLKATFGTMPRGILKAVFPVHLNGQTAPMEEIAGFARSRGLAVIEDGCHALGTTYTTSTGEAARVGDCRFSNMTVFSFHAVKTITTGEGGAITTNDPALARRLKTLRNHGMVYDDTAFVDRDSGVDDSGRRNPWYYEMQTLGYNYRVSDIQCALGLSQLARLEQFSARRRLLMQLYDEKLKVLAPLVHPVPRIANCDPTLHIYPVLIDFETTGVARGELMRQLRQRGIGTQVHYYPVHRQPYYRQLYGDRDLPGARLYYERVLSLPFFARMVERDVQRVVNALWEIFRQ